MNVDSRAIRAERYAEIGAAIQRDAAILIDRWARRVHHEALLDHLPTFLWELGSELAQATDPDSCLHCRPARQHGEQRWEVGWSLAEVVRDYRLLRLVILEHLDEILGRPLRLREAQAVGLALDEAVEVSVERYVHCRDDQLSRVQAAHDRHHKEAQRELSRWKEVFQHAGWGMALLDPADHTLQAVNPALARMHGYEAADLVGKPVAFLVAPESRPVLGELLRGAETGTLAGEVVHSRQDNSSFPVLAAFAACKDQAGAVTCLAANFQDITDRRRLEDSLREQADALRDADERKNEFLAVLAHELRNPLAPLRNALEVVRLGGDSAAGVGQVREMMERQVRQMTRLVDDLLDMARIAQGKLALRRARVDLRQGLEQAVQMNAPLRDERRHHMTTSLPGEPLWLDGDQDRLVQVVVNLLNNAARYTPEGGHIELTAWREGDDVVVRVKDSGVGIPAEKLDSIFDLFAQLDRGPERGGGGLGIGLSLVRRLVELHGGTVRASSPGPGKGSEFIVRLPAHVSASAPGRETPVQGEGEAEAPGRHVLIVEDNRDGRESLARLLRLLGHRVDTAEDGVQGVAAALSLRPEVALIDIGLPGLDGYQVARQVRQALGETVLLVALTGYGTPADRAQADEAGFDTHLLKPVDLEVLQGLLSGRQQPLP